MDNLNSSEGALPADFKNTPEEIAIMETIDWTRRLWPKADRFTDDDGEWTLTIKGTEEEFLSIHRLLTRQGYCVQDADETYVKDPDFEPHPAG